MKGLFKAKPRTIVELVHQTRELLIYADQNTETRERKREEKVVQSALFLFFFFFFLQYCPTIFRVD